MSLDELKNKAAEIKKELQPKVKEKAQQVGNAVSDFVDEHLRSNDDSVEPESKVVGEAEYVDATIEEDTEKMKEAEEKGLFGKGKKKKSKKKAKTVKFREADAETPAEDTENKEKPVDAFEEILSSQDDAADAETKEGSATEKTDEIKEEPEISDDKDASEEEKSELERIEGEVVDTVKDKFGLFKQNVMPKVKDAASVVGEKFKDTASFVGEKVKDAASGIGSKAKNGFQNVGPKIKESAENVGPKIKETAQNIGPKIKETAQNVGPKIKETAQNVGPKIKETAQNVGPKIKETAQSVGPKIKETAQTVGPKVYSGAKKTGETISFQGYRLRKTIGKKLRNSIKAKLGIKSDDDPGTPDGIKYYEVKKKRRSKFFSHLHTINTHRHLVFKHCLKAGIPVQGLLHDLSKYSPSEFYYGVKFYSGDRSPNEGEREDHGCSYAWMHHKGRNKHHFEYWNDYNIEANKALPVKMPLKYVIEMFCDRVAASKVYLKDKYTNLCPYEYFDKGRSRRTINKETSDFLEKLLKMLAQKGEEYTFMYIKWYKKHHKDY